MNKAVTWRTYLGDPVRLMISAEKRHFYADVGGTRTTIQRKRSITDSSKAANLAYFIDPSIRQGHPQASMNYRTQIIQVRVILSNINTGVLHAPTSMLLDIEGTLLQSTSLSGSPSRSSTTVLRTVCSAGRSSLFM